MIAPETSAIDVFTQESEDHSNQGFSCLGFLFQMLFQAVEEPEAYICTSILGQRHTKITKK